MPSPQILVHRSDEQLDDELKQAFGSSSEVRPILHFRSGLRESIEAASAYQPSMVIVELDSDLENLRVLVDEVAAVSPHSAVVAVFSVDSLATGASESALMIQALRTGVEDFLRRPVSSRDLAQLCTRRLGPRRTSPVQPGRTISFISNKGGVGKSTIAVNAAVGLAQRHPGRVLLLDASLQLGVCAAQLNLHPETSLIDAWQQRDRLDERLLRQLTTPHPSGLHLLAAPGSAIESVELDDAIVSRILLLARRSYDWVIVDTFPLFDRVVMAILDLSDAAFVVVENAVPTLQTVRGFFQLLADVEFPVDRQRLVVNRYTTQASSPNRDEVERYLERDITHVVPFDKKVLLAANTGQPLVSSAYRFSKSIRAIRKLVDEIEQLHQQPVGRVNDAANRFDPLGYPPANAAAGNGQVSPE